MAYYQVYLENKTVVYVNATGVIDAMDLAEVRFGLNAVDAEIYDPLFGTEDELEYLRRTR